MRLALYLRENDIGNHTLGPEGSDRLWDIIKSNISPMIYSQFLLLFGSSLECKLHGEVVREFRNGVLEILMVERPRRTTEDRRRAREVVIGKHESEEKHDAKRVTIGNIQTPGPL